MEFFETKELYLMFTIFFGMVFGSFATALIYRLPREINFVSERSNCTSCGYKLRVLDLFPIFSYIFLRGKCRSCGTKISANYLIIEIIITLSFVAIFLDKGINYQSAILMLLAFSIIVLSAIDFEHYIIPDEVNIFIFVLGILYHIQSGFDLQQMIILPIFLAGFSLALRWAVTKWKNQEALGLGDVKLFAGVGAFLPLQDFAIFLLLSGGVGFLIAIIWKIFKRGDIFPFGPAIGIAMFICVYFPNFGQWYLQLFS
jgi:leader peptidase (prepilin peptidase)/N-methyltransferase